MIWGFPPSSIIESSTYATSSFFNLWYGMGIWSLSICAWVSSAVNATVWSTTNVNTFWKSKLYWKKGVTFAHKKGILTSITLALIKMTMQRTLPTNLGTNKGTRPRLKDAILSPSFLKKDRGNEFLKLLSQITKISVYCYRLRKWSKSPLAVQTGTVHVAETADSLLQAIDVLQHPAPLCAHFVLLTISCVHYF